jgi:hypothetical protein
MPRAATPSNCAAGKINASNWQIAIRPRLRARGHVLSVVCDQSNGLADLTGYLPLRPSPSAPSSAATPPPLRRASRQALPRLWPGSMPAQLTDGKAAFDGSRWVLTDLSP